MHGAGSAEDNKENNAGTQKPSTSLVSFQESYKVVLLIDRYKSNPDSMADSDLRNDIDNTVEVPISNIHSPILNKRIWISDAPRGVSWFSHFVM